MTEKRWKRAERMVAKFLLGERVPVSGRGRGDNPDVAHPRLAIEVKSRRRLPAWLEDAMRQAEAAAQVDQKPVVVLHQSGERYADALVVMRLRFLGELLEEK